MEPAEGWVARNGTGWRAHIARDGVDAAEAAGWLSPPDFGGLIDASAKRGAGPLDGRGETRVVELADSSGTCRLRVRPLRRGGLLARVLGRRLARPDRPLREVAINARLLLAGAPVVRPFLGFARRVGAVHWEGIVVTHDVEETPTLGAFLASRPARGPRRACLRAVGGALRRFHDCGGRHRDLNLGNVLAGDGRRVWILDLDGAALRAPVPPRRRMRELMRLYRSARKTALPVDTRDALALFRGYWRGGDATIDRALRRALLRWLPAERLRVAFHALAYRRPAT